MKKLLYLFLVFLCYEGLAQSLSVFDVDATSFPTVVSHVSSPLDSEYEWGTIPRAPSTKCLVRAGQGEIGSSTTGDPGPRIPASHLMAEEVNWYMINQCNRLGDILNNKNTKQIIHIAKRQDYPDENINTVMIEKIIKFKFYSIF